MALFSDDFMAMNGWGEQMPHDLELIEDCYQYALDNAVEVIEYGDLEAITETDRAAANLRVFQQVQFHKVRAIFSELDHLTVTRNTYLLSLGVRSLFETAGSAGYVCKRLASLEAGTIEFEDFAFGLADMIMAARHEIFDQARQGVNILTAIDGADAYLDRHYFPEKRGMLRNCYDWLSDYTHPNFLANTIAFHINRETRAAHIGEGVDEPANRRQLIGHVTLFSVPFMFFHDEISRHLEARTIHGAA